MSVPEPHNLFSEVDFTAMALAAGTVLYPHSAMEKGCSI